MSTDLLLPADTLPGMLVGWTGGLVLDGESCVVMGRDDDYPNQWLLSRPQGWDVMNVTTWCRSAETHELSLDLRRPEVRDRLARVLADGVKCEHDCEQWPQRANMSGHEWVVCSRCGAHTDKGEIGYLRKPAPVWHLLDAERAGILSPEHVGIAIGWSVRSVAAGGEVLRGVLPEWRTQTHEDWSTSMRGDPASDVLVIVGTERWGLYVNGPCVAGGPETGPEGRSCADRAALLAGFGYIEAGALVVPEIGGDRG